MTLTKGLLASVAEATSDPGEILREVNRHLYIACGKKMFVTLLLGIVDTSERTFSYARAGHNPPVWRRAAEEETRLLRAKGLGLGLNSGEVFNRALVVETIRLESRDKLVLYSDGITEAMNGERVEYGEERLMEIAARSDALNAEEMRDAILKDVSDFLGTVPPQDDQTLVVLQVA
jgi:sigma-B regulation protein RsbU (phosphoserine phosphatase)